MKRRILSIFTALALALSLCPSWALAAESGSDPVEMAALENTAGVSNLLVLGQPVSADEITTGNGWAFDPSTNTLTLDNLTVRQEDYPEGVVSFLSQAEPKTSVRMTIYLKGNNTICGMGINDHVFSLTAVSTLITLTGDSDATLTIEGGWVQGHFEVSGPIHFIVNEERPFQVDNGIKIDQGAKLTVNYKPTCDSSGPTGMFLVSAGGISIANGSTLEVNTLSTDYSIENNTGIYNIYGAGPFSVESDSALILRNDHPNGQAMRALNPLGAYTGYGNDYIRIENSVVNIDSRTGIRAYSTIDITNSTVSSTDKTGCAWVGDYGKVTIQNSDVNGIAVSYLSDANTPTEYIVYGEANLPANLTIAEGAALAIPEGASLDVHNGVTLTNNGTVRIHNRESLTETSTLSGNGTFVIDLTEDLISGIEGLIYNGQNHAENIKLEGTATICGVEFTADTVGWTRSISPTENVTEMGNYTVTYTKGTETITKNFTVEPCPHTGTAFTPNADGTHTGTCESCDQTITAAHTWDDSYVCTICGTQAVAKVEKDGSTTYVTSLDGVFASNSGNAGATITLLADVVKNEGTPVAINCTLDLGGHTLSGGANYVLRISGTPGTPGITVTIKDSGNGGTISNGASCALSIGAGGTVILEGGRFCTSSSIETHSAISVSNTGKLRVTGEDVVIENTGGGYGLDISGLYESYSVQLSAGTYSGPKGAIHIWPKVDSQPDVSLGDLLAYGSAFYNSDTPIQLQPDGKTLTGTVMVKACTHIFGSSTTCLACGSSAVAQVTIDETTIYYGDIESAWNSARGKTATLKLLQSADLGSSSLQLSSGNVTLEMAEGVTLSSANASATIVIYGGTLTINSGTVSNTRNCGIQNRGGTLRITGGVFNGSGSTQSGVWADNGTTEISGGTINKFYPQQNANVSLSGGSFGSIEIWNLTIGERVADLLADGYTFQKDGKWENANGNRLSGPVTVVKAPVKITEQPQGTTATYSETAMLSVTAEAADSTNLVTYAWHIEGVSGSFAGAASTQISQNAGTYQVYCDVTCDGYTVRSDTVTVTVNPKPVTASIQGTATKTYDGTTACDGSGLSIALDGVVDGDAVTAAAGSYAYDSPNAGERTITATGITLGGEGSGNYTLSNTTATATGTITKSTPTIAFKDTYNPNKTYDGQTIATPAAEDAVTITGANFSDVKFTWSAAPLNAGDYMLTATIPETNNTEAASATKTVTISKAPGKVTITATNKTYDGEPYSGLTIVERLGTGTVTVKYSGMGYDSDQPPVKAGPYRVVVIVEEDENYATAGAQVDFRIDSKPAEIEWSNTVLTYNGEMQAPTATVTNAVGDDEVTVLVDGGQYVVGTYTATVGGLAGADAENYSLSFERPTTTFTIQKANPTVTGVTVTGPAKIYESTDPSAIQFSFTASTEGTLTLDASTKLEPGRTNYTATFTPKEYWFYNTVTVPVTLTVLEDTLQSITITTQPDKTTYTYGESFDKTGMVVTANYESGATKVVTDDVTVSPAALEAATTALTITYQGKTAAQAITVNPKEVTNPTIELSPDSFVYDSTEKTPAVTVKDGGTVIPSGEYTVEYSGNINVGDATVTVTDRDGGNYTIAQTTGTFTITKANQAPLTITGAPDSVTYGDTFQLGFSGGSGTGAVSWAASGATVDNTGKVAITSAGTVILTVTKAGDSNYTGTEARITLNAGKKELTPSITGTTTKPYDGTTDVAAGQFSITLTGVVDGDTVTAAAGSYAYDSPNAGERTITATGITLGGEDAGNYRLASDSAAIPGTITKADQAAPNPPAAADANIKDTGITLTAIENAEYSKDGTNWQESPEFTGLDPNTAYTFYARLKEDANHNASPASAGTPVTTKKTAINGAAVTVSGTYTYTGAAQTPAVSVRLGDTPLTEGADYTVSYTNNTGAGTAAVTVTGAGKYEGTATTTFTIQPKTLTVTGATAQDRQYNGANTVTVTGVTLDGVVDGDAVSVDTANLTGTISGTDAGDYTALTLPALTLTGEKAGNYTLTRPAGAVSTDVTIGKAVPLPPKPGDLAVANGRAHTYIFGLGALRPDVPVGMSLGSTAVTYTLGAVSLGSYYTGGAEIDGQTLTLPVEAVESDRAEGIGTVTVTIHTGNFQDMTATIHVRSVNKTVPTGGPALSADTLTYGQALGSITLSGSMRDGETDVPGTFAWSSPDNRPTVQETYSAAWTFTPADNDKYAIVNGTSAIQVVPASIAGADVTLSQTAFRYDGQPHSPGVTGVKLGDTMLTADVDYTAEIPQGTDGGTYTVTLTGKGNYTGTATATFTINPVETGDEFEDESGTLLRLEVETGLSTVPAALVNDARYDTPEKIETALRTQVEQVMTNVGENIAVFDVTLRYRDESGTWRTVDPNDFPAEGVTAILPYPAGTGATGYTFTVQHLISSGAQAGTMETLSYTLTADGLQCQFSSLSPVAIGYQAVAKPVDPVEPNPGGSSGGGGAGTYAVTVEKPEHGKVTSSRTNAGSGSTVTLTVTPDTGYVLDTLTATDSRGSEIRLTAQGDGKYVFTMPGRAVTVMATFAPLPDGTACDGGEECPSRGFPDLGGVGTWYHEAVDYVLRNDLMGGYGNGKFGPDDTLTRAQFAQILYNKEGRPNLTGGNLFADVAPGAWCAPAITWAAECGIVGGYGNGMFGPNDNITREQLAVMLWRYAGSPAATDKELHFTDADQASGYALEALRWAVEKGVINGKDGGLLDPKGLATRAQTAQMLMNFFYLSG